jgi:hypothetical protein
MRNYWRVAADYLAPNGIALLSPRGPQIEQYLAEIEGK